MAHYFNEIITKNVGIEANLNPKKDGEMASEFPLGYSLWYKNLIVFVVLIQSVSL